jgi:hypothetical protein
MNNLPQNELLSAYLDGELTAAEQADVERLLAANPAARQLLDELRALSTALQSLPQQKLGEDLSAQVLRVAERRMLTAGEPDDALAKSEPFSRMIFRRFLNRRALVWTGIAAAVAIMIAINEDRQKDQHANRELAKAPAARDVDKDTLDKSEKSRKMSHELPAIRAVPEVVAKAVTTSPAKSAAEKMPASKAKACQPAEKAMGGGMSDKEGEPLRGKIAGGMPVQSALEIAEEEEEKRGVTNLAAPRQSPPSAHMGKAAGGFRNGRGYGGQAGMGAAQQIGQSASDVLVVYCDISPDAAKNKSFDKLLDANGIPWHRKLLQENKKQAVYRKSEPQSDAFGMDRGGRDLPLAADPVLRRAVASGSAELVYAEATPAQVRATLAGLEAQPNVFLAFSVRPAQNELAQQFASGLKSERGGGESKRNSTTSGSTGQELVKNHEETRSLSSQESGEQAVAKKGDASANIANREPRDNAQNQRSGQPQPPAAVAAPPGSNSQAKAGELPNAVPTQPQDMPGMSLNDAKQADIGTQQRFFQRPLKEDYSQAATRQRVLFVLRVSGGPAAAEASAKSPAKADVDAAKPAAPSPAEHAPAK